MSGGDDIIYSKGASSSASNADTFGNYQKSVVPYSEYYGESVMDQESVYYRESLGSAFSPGSRYYAESGVPSSGQYGESFVPPYSGGVIQPQLPSYDASTELAGSMVAGFTDMMRIAI